MNRKKRASKKTRSVKCKIQKRKNKGNFCIQIHRGELRLTGENNSR
jgi:hypothetical protein